MRGTIAGKSVSASASTKHDNMRLVMSVAGVGLAFIAIVVAIIVANKRPDAAVLGRMIEQANRPCPREEVNEDDKAKRVREACKEAKKEPQEPVFVEITFIESRTKLSYDEPTIMVQKGGTLYSGTHWLGSAGFECVEDPEAGVLLIRHPKIKQIVAFSVGLNKGFILKSATPFHVDAWWRAAYGGSGRDLQMAPEMEAKPILSPPIMVEGDILLPIRCIAAALGSDPNRDVIPEMPRGECTEDNPLRITIILRDPVTIDLLEKRKRKSVKRTLPPSLLEVTSERYHLLTR